MLHSNFNILISKITMKTLSKTSRPNPSLRCHEEVMSKCSSYASNGELVCCRPPENASEKVKGNKLTQKERISKKITKKPVNVKFQDLETVSAPVENGSVRDSCSKSERSKSVPLIKNKFEDSVDFIPVKLTTDNDYKQRTQNSSKLKLNFKSTVKSNFSRPSRPTWDKLLRGESEDLYHSNQLTDKNKKLKHHRTINNQIDQDLRNEPKITCRPTQSCNVSNSNNYGNTDCSKKFLNSPHTENMHLNELYDSDPASTLDVLIKQLRDRLINQPENENLQTIILDMENALLKISVQNHECLSENKGKSLFNSLPQSSNVGTNPCYSEGTSKKSSSHDMNIVTQLKTKLEESCIYLQSLCMKQREYCRNKTEEQEQLTIQLAESRRLLAIAKSKEKDYEIKIGEFRLQIQEANSKMLKQNENIQALNDSVSKLKAENEILRSFKESAKRLNFRLKEISNEKEILQSKLGLKELQVEKLKFLLAAKENLNPETVHKKEKEYTQFAGPEINFDITEENKEISSLSTATSWTQQNAIIACSSQASSSPRHSPSPYNSWQHISSICQQAAAASELNKGIAGIFQSLQSKTEQNHPPQLELELLSSSNSFWSDNEDQDGKSKVALSDIDSETLSS